VVGISVGWCVWEPWPSGSSSTSLCLAEPTHVRCRALHSMHTGNCGRVTHDRLTVKGSMTSLKRMSARQHLVEKNRDLYHTSDTHASVQQCRFSVRETIVKLRARPFTLCYFITDYPSDGTRVPSTRDAGRRPSVVQHPIRPTHTASQAPSSRSHM
jgi:hypothetical protein